MPSGGAAAQGAFGGVIREANPAFVEEAGEGFPPAEHVVEGLGEAVVARKPGELRGEPGVQFGHQRRAELVPRSKPLGSILAIDGALDIEQSIHPLHGLECNRVDHAGMFASAHLAGSVGDVGQLEQLAPRVTAPSVDDEALLHKSEAAGESALQRAFAATPAGRHSTR